MRKQIAVVAVAAIMAAVPVMCPVAAQATVDESIQYVSIDTLDSMSFEALLQLQTRVNAQLAEKATWKDVEVPQGVWVVGEDIPAGKWTVTCAVPDSFTTVSWGNALKDNGEDIDYRRSDRYSTSNMVGKSAFADTETYSFEVREGDYIVIEHKPAIFNQYAGKPKLGF